MIGQTTREHNTNYISKTNELLLAFEDIEMKFQIISRNNFIISALISQ